MLGKTEIDRTILSYVKQQKQIAGFGVKYGNTFIIRKHMSTVQMKTGFCQRFICAMMMEFESYYCMINHFMSHQEKNRNIKSNQLIKIFTVKFPNQKTKQLIWDYENVVIGIFMFNHIHRKLCSIKTVLI